MARTGVFARVRWPEALALIGLGLAAFATRFLFLGEWSVWGDELYSWTAAEMSLQDMWRWTAYDLHPPLYYAALHYWVDAFGDSEASLRAPSALAGSLTIVIFATALMRVSRPIAISAGVLLVLNAPFLFFAREARMYSMTALFAVTCAVGWGMFQEKPSPIWWACWLLSGVALVWTDYSGFFLVGILAGLSLARWLFTHRQGRSTKQLLPLAVFGMLIVILYAPWWPHFFDHAEHGATEQHIVRPTWGSAWSVFGDAFGLERAAGLARPVAGLLLAGGTLGVARRWRDQPIVVGIAALALVPVAQLAFSLVDNPVFDLKRVSPYVPGLVLLAVLAGAELLRFVVSSFNGNRALAMAVVAAPVALIATLTAQGTVAHYRAEPVEDWRVVAAVVPDGVQIAGWRPYVPLKLQYYLRDRVSYLPITRPAVDAARQGFVVFPRENADDTYYFFSVPANDGVELNPLLSAVEPYFTTVQQRVFPRGESLVVLRARSRAQYNVSLDDNWVSGDDGYLMPTHGARFTRRDITLEVPATLVVERPDDASLLISRDGKPQLVKSEHPLGDGWVRITYDLPLGFAGPFTVEASGELRRLELNRTSVDPKIAIGRDESSLGRVWFLRPDGYLQSVGGQGCVAIQSMPRHRTLAIEYFEGFTLVSASATLDPSQSFQCIAVPPSRPIASIRFAE